MSPTILELSPFLAGVLLGFICATRFGQSFFRVAITAPGSVAVGSACCFLAGEFSRGWLAAIAPAIFDIVAVAVGWIAASYVAKNIFAQWRQKFSFESGTRE